MSRFNPMIGVSLVFAMLFLLAVIYFSMMTPIRSAHQIKLISGEWPPYTGEDLESQGIAAAIVTHILGQMGYRAEYEFMPWELGEALAGASQRDDEVRGIFPYMKTAEREKQFYFSRGIINIVNTAFYHKEHTPKAAEIDSADDLSAYRILTLQGYDYHPDIKPYLPTQPCPKKDTLEAMRHLADPIPLVLLTSAAIDDSRFNSAIGIRGEATGQAFSYVDRAKLRFPPPSDQSGKTIPEAEYFVYFLTEFAQGQADYSSVGKLRNQDVLVVKGDLPPQLLRSIPANVCRMDSLENALETFDEGRKPPLVFESLDVGQELLSQRLPQLLPVIRRTGYTLEVEQAVMFSRNNPNNLALRDEFDRHLSKLKANINAYNALVSGTRTRIDLAMAVRIEPFGKRDLVAAYAVDERSGQCDRTNRVYLPKGSKGTVTEWPLAFLRFQQALGEPMVKVRLLNGPMASIGRSFCVDGRAAKLP